MDYKFIIGTTLDIVLIIIGLYLVFWKSYFGEKGKNIATKEDIEEITQKIEIVKNEIGIHSQRRLEFLNDRKMSSLTFLNSTSIFLDLSIRPLADLYNKPTNTTVISNLISDSKEKMAEITTSYWKLYIYFDNEVFIGIANELYESCVEIYNLISETLLNIERTAVHVNRINDLFYQTRDNDKREELNSQLKDLNEETNKLFTNYIEKSRIMSDTALKNRMKYTVLLSKVLKVKNPSL